MEAGKNIRLLIPVFCAFIFLLSLKTGAQPVISSFTPVSGPPGTSVTISGSNFNTTPASNIVYFGAVKASVSAATASTLTVSVPPGATYQPITVTVGGLTASSLRPFIPTFSGGGNINPTSFETKVDFTTDLHPNGLALSDLDGDGKTDIATPNNYSTTGFPASVSVLRNTSSGGTISFAPKQDINTGVATYAIAAGDLDGDGKQDLVSSSIADQTISIHRNTSSSGSISFAPKIDLPAGSNTYSIAIGDIDGDGRPDIAFVNYFSQSLSVYRNTGSVGTISFAPKQDFTTALAPYNLVLADLDGDGKQDIALTNRLSSSFSIFRNTSTSGSISFGARIDITNGSGNESCGINETDLDGDNKADLSVVIYITSTNNSAVQMFRNASTPGNISFPYAGSVSGGVNNAYFITTSDINGDAKPDLAFGLTDLGKTKIFQNNSTPGNFILTESGEFFSFSPYAIAAVDLENDGKPDLITTNFISDNISVLKNRCGLPGIISFTPMNGTTGTVVTISGNNFTGATSVTFGGVAASSFTVVNQNTITAVVASGASGNVVVTTPLGAGSLSGFVYFPVPTIISFAPTSAGTGTTVTITGTGFTGASAVSFGGVAASSFTVVNSTTITAVVAGGASGNVSVTTPGGTATLPGFTYTGPTIISFTPTSGGVGTVVTITGTNFTSANSVSFGGTPATSFTVVNSTTITATVGAGATGNVTVTTPSGTATLPGFTYIAPTITSFTPTSGNTGTIITITGTNFTGTTAVSFGGTPASSFTVVNATTLTAVVGAGSSGNVSVTTPYGTATRAGFTYTGPPVITSFTPLAAGPGATIVITGAHFTGTTAVSFGGTAAASFSVISYTTIHAVVATGSSGNVSVTTPYGTASLAGFTFIPLPWINSFSPASGPIGTTVTISGGNFSTVPANNIVYFGAVRAVVTAASVTSLSVTVPAGATYEPISVLVNTLTAYSKTPFIVTFPHYGNTAFGSGSFAAKMDFPVSANLRHVAISDIDGDSKPDIAVANQMQLGVSVIRNTSTAGNLSFSAQVDFPTGFQNQGVFIKDMDGDGRSDLMLGGPTYLNLLRNTSTTGNISFASGVNLVTGSAPLLSYAEDLDGDGKPDIVSANYYGESVSILRNMSTTGNISFAPKIDLSSPGSRPLNIKVADIDGDNKPDIIVSKNNPDGVTVFRNTSSIAAISFAPAVSFAAGSEPAGLTVGDLDGDGKPDVVTANYLSANASVFRNTSTAGTISFATSTFASNVGSGTNIALGDINGDGKLDMAIGNGAFAALFNNTSVAGNISFASKVDYLIGPNSFNDAIGDLDGDGRPDVASQFSQNGDYVSVLRNKVGDLGIMSFTPASGTTGNTITITGSGFTGATVVSFGGVPATSFTVVNATTITAVVGAGASGNVSVTTPGGIASVPGFTYTIVTGVGNPSGNSKELLVSPNPSDDLIRVKYPLSGKPVRLRIIDMTGREVMAIVPSRGSRETTLSVKKLVPGIYRITWSDGTRLLSRTLMVKPLQ